MARTRRSYIIQAYNKASAVANAGDHGFERQRLNRALGLALSPHKMAGKVKLYGTTIRNCNCPDRRKGRYLKTNRVCKHMMALMIVERAKTYAIAEVGKFEAEKIFRVNDRQKLGSVKINFKTGQVLPA